MKDEKDLFWVEQGDVLGQEVYIIGVEGIVNVKVGSWGRGSVSLKDEFLSQVRIEGRRRVLEVGELSRI